MIFKLYTIRDVKTAQYGNPLVFINDGQAIRTISDQMQSNQEGNLLRSHPEDFELLSIGSYDSDTGVVSAIQHDQVIHLSQLVKVKE